LIIKYKFAVTVTFDIKRCTSNQLFVSPDCQVMW